MKSRKTIGLALGSGAYRGFAHIGVIKSLEKNNIPIDYLSGASIGAWVAAYYAIFGNVSQLENDLIDNRKENLSLLFDPGWKGGLVQGKKFVDYLEKKLHNHDFSDLKIPLQIVATDLYSGQPFVFQNGEVALAVRASASVPLIFKPLAYEDKLLVDGGLSNPVPGDLVKNMGADIVISVNLYNKNEFPGSKISVSNIALRSTTIALYNLSKTAIHNCDVLIEPDTSKFIKESNLSKYFTKEIADQMIDIGERAADEAIPKIKKLLGL